jgi:hypothetical protein
MHFGNHCAEQITEFQAVLYIGMAWYIDFISLRMVARS